MYHYVRPIKNSVYPRVKGLEIDAFTQQINYFKKNFHVLTASEFIDGLISLEDAIELIKLNTRKYSKRQMTWFKKNKNILWFEKNDKHLIERLKKINN